MAEEKGYAETMADYVGYAIDYGTGFVENTVDFVGEGVKSGLSTVGWGVDKTAGGIWSGLTAVKDGVSYGLGKVKDGALYAADYVGTMGKGLASYAYDGVSSLGGTIKDAFDAVYERGSQDEGLAKRTVDNVVQKTKDTGAEKEIG